MKLAHKMAAYAFACCVAAGTVECSVKESMPVSPSCQPKLILQVGSHAQVPQVATGTVIVATGPIHTEEQARAEISNLISRLQDEEEERDARRKQMYDRALSLSYHGAHGEAFSALMHARNEGNYDFDTLMITANIYRNWGRFLRSTGSEVDGLKKLQDAIKFAWEAESAQIHKETRNQAERIAFAESGIKLSSRDAEPTCLKMGRVREFVGDCYTEMGDRENAAASYRSAIGQYKWQAQYKADDISRLERLIEK